MTLPCFMAAPVPDGAGARPSLTPAGRCVPAIVDLAGVSRAGRRHEPERQLRRLWGMDAPLLLQRSDPRSDALRLLHNIPADGLFLCPPLERFAVKKIFS